VLMVSIAERVMDGSDPVYKEIAGLSAARRVHAPVNDAAAKSRVLLRQQGLPSHPVWQLSRFASRI